MGIRGVLSLSLGLVLCLTSAAPVKAEGRVGLICRGGRARIGEVPAVCPLVQMRGDSSANVLVLSVPEDADRGALTISSGDLDCDDPNDVGEDCTLINGELEISFDRIGGLAMDLRAGNDVLLITSELYSKRGFGIYMGDGDDTVSIESSINGTLAIRTHDGDDEVFVASFGDDMSVHRLIIETGDGSDEVEVSGVEVRDALIVTTGSGRDEVEITAGVVESFTEVVLGDGPDEFRTGLGQQYNDFTNLQGEEGDDTFDLTLNEDGENYAAFNGELSIDGYEGFDTLYWEEGVIIPTDPDDPNVYGIEIYDVESCPLALAELCED